MAPVELGVAGGGFRRPTTSRKRSVHRVRMPADAVVREDQARAGGGERGGQARQALHRREIEIADQSFPDEERWLCAVEASAFQASGEVLLQIGAAEIG